MNIKTLDKVIALLLLAFFLGYLFLSFNFELLPFERHHKFRPDSLPKAIGIIGNILAIIVLFTATGEQNDDNKRIRQYDFKKLIFIILCMIVYATLLKPAGFVVSTVLFIIIGAIILGERKYLKLIIVAFIGALSIWLIVDKVLGIYLYPIPMFFQENNLM